MKVETSDEDSSVWIKIRVNDLVSYHTQDLALYRVDEQFVWRAKTEDFELVASVEDFFGESELDFAEEYLLLHGNDEIAYPWEPLEP